MARSPSAITVRVSAVALWLLLSAALSCSGSAGNTAEDDEERGGEAREIARKNAESATARTGGMFEPVFDTQDLEEQLPDAGLQKDYYEWFACRGAERIAEPRKARGSERGARPAEPAVVLPTGQDLEHTPRCIGFTREGDASLVMLADHFSDNDPESSASHLRFEFHPNAKAPFAPPSVRLPTPPFEGAAAVNKRLQGAYAELAPDLNAKLAKAGLMPCITAASDTKGEVFDARPNGIPVQVRDEKGFLVVQRKGSKPRRIRKLSVEEGDGGDHEFVSAVFYRPDSAILVVVIGNDDTGQHTESVLVGCIPEEPVP